MASSANILRPRVGYYCSGSSLGRLAAVAFCMLSSLAWSQPSCCAFRLGSILTPLPPPSAGPRRRLSLLLRQSTATRSTQFGALLQRSIRSNDDDHDLHDSALSRRQWFGSSLTASLLAAATTTGCVLPPAASAVDVANDATDESSSLTVQQTPSGLKYIDLQLGTGRSPAYGNFCTIAYQAYIKLPDGSRNANTQPQQFDSSQTYLIKHGNGRTVAGLDEGLHTMRVGGVRRILVPPKLGFVEAGLGPLPESPWNRFRLNQLLDDMVAVSGGTLIYQVKLLQVLDDEADQGYYSDDSLTPEDFATLRENLRQKGNEQLRQQAAENSLGVTGQERLL